MARISESFVIETPLNNLEIILDDGKIKRINLNSPLPERLPQTQLGKRVSTQIIDYLSGRIEAFDLPVIQKGTEHQMKVWKALTEIPKGSVLTYGDLAKIVGSSARAIGNACRTNPVPLIVPCHRVVSAKDIGGFSGAKDGVLLDIKKKLLLHEGLSF